MTRHTPIYTLDGLAAETEMTPRTIRKWIEQRVVPPAYPRIYHPSQDMRYGRDHVEAIRRVKAIREANVTLADIRDRLYPDHDE